MTFYSHAQAKHCGHISMATINVVSTTKVNALAKPAAAAHQLRLAVCTVNAKGAVSFVGDPACTAQVARISQQEFPEQVTQHAQPMHPGDVYGRDQQPQFWDQATVS